MLTEQKNCYKTFEDYLVSCVTKGMVEMADADMLKKMQDECKCSYCNGVGTVTHSENVFQDGLGCYEWVTTKETCTDCKGTGVSKNIK